MKPMKLISEGLAGALCIFLHSKRVSSWFCKQSSCLISSHSGSGFIVRITKRHACDARDSQLVRACDMM
jgi:hypothetical protein